MEVINMITHVKFHEDSDGQLVDADWYCSEFCYTQAGHVESGAWPGGAESDNCILCSECGRVISHGLTNCEHNVKIPKLKLEINISDSLAGKIKKEDVLTQFTKEVR